MANYIRHYEGFNIYPAGAIAANYPWYVPNSAFVGQIVADSGPFPSAKTLSFAATSATLTVGTELQFPSQTQPLVNSAATNADWLLGLGFWFNCTRANNGTYQLISLGTSASATPVMGLVGIDMSAANGLRLQFATNLNAFTTTPFYYPILTDAWYWIDYRLASYSNAGAATAAVNVRINDAEVLNQAATFTGTPFSAGQVSNRIKFAVSSNLDYKVDDFVIRAACAADPDWSIAGANPVITDMPFMTSRRVYDFDATANGSVNQWASSDGTTPNYQAASDPTGTKFVVASDLNLTDLYKFDAKVGETPTGIAAVLYRGNSTKFNSVQPLKKVGATTDNLNANSQQLGAGAARFIAVSETDGTNPWTQASIEAAEFGQKSV